MKTVILILVLTSLVFSMPYTVLANGYSDVSVIEAKTMIDYNSSLVVLDVRSQSEYNSGHIRNTKLIPHTELAGRLDELNETDEILVYCLSGGRSAIASQILVDNGFEYVYNMLGGITAWKSEGYPVYIKYSSIQEAINNAGEGDTIFASLGTYYENIVVNKTVSLIGENEEKAIIDGNWTGNVVEITADNVNFAEFTIRNTQYSGVVVSNSTGTRLNRNNIENFGEYGIYLGFSNNSTLTENVVIGRYWYDFGIRVSWSNSCIISGNDISGGWALFLHRSYNSTVTNNIVFAIGKYGIRLAWAYGNLIVSNDVFNATSTLSGLSYGIWISYASTDNLVFRNNFFNNTVQAYGHNLTNAWDNGFEGNFWSDYNGTDLDGDGIGDTPYVIDANNTDHYPLVNPYWNPGDVDHDLDVDLYDAVKVLVAYGSEQGDPEYNPYCDIAEPYNKIDLFDAVLILINYGKKYS